MVKFKNEFLELLNRTERCTIRRMEALMSREMTKIKNDTIQEKKRMSEMMSLMVNKAKKGEKVCIIDERPAIGETRKITFKEFSTGGLIYELPEQLRKSIIVDIYSIIEPSTGIVVNNATRRPGTEAGIRVFHTNGNSTCYGTALKSMKTKDTNEAINAMEKLLEVVNPESFLGYEDFLIPIVNYTLQEYNIRRRIESAKSFEKEPMCLICTDRIKEEEYKKHMEEKHHKCKICGKIFEEKIRSEECEEQCKKDFEMLDEYNKQYEKVLKEQKVKKDEQE